jgi:hypothetical protein
MVKRDYLWFYLVVFFLVTTIPSTQQLRIILGTPHAACVAALHTSSRNMHILTGWKYGNWAFAHFAFP